MPVVGSKYDPFIVFNCIALYVILNIDIMDAIVFETDICNMIESNIVIMSIN